MINTKIKKTTGQLKTVVFRTDDLHKFYNFESNETGEVLISAKIITDLYERKIASVYEAEIAKRIIEFVRNYDIIDEQEERDSHNWNIYATNGEIEIRSGHLLKKITMNEDEYLEYLNEIIKSGIATYIEFII